MATLRNVKEYGGEVVFYKNTEYDFISCSPCDKNGNISLLDDQVEIGRAKVDVTFSDSTEAEIQALEATKKKVLAEAHMAAKRIEEKIQNLRALTHQG